jgi:hypothetical protein
VGGAPRMGVLAGNGMSQKKLQTSPGLDLTGRAKILL